LEPAALPTVATVVDEELQVTDAVISRLLLSEKMPVAVNYLVVPSAMIGLTGATSIETRFFPLKLASPPPLQPNVKLNNSAPHIKQSNLI
jgi:hypothetical protein